MKKNHHQAISFSLLVMTACAIIVTTIVILYYTALESEKRNLAVLANIQSNLLDAYAEGGVDTRTGVADLTSLRSRLIDVIETQKTFGDSGEFVLGFREGDNIHFAFEHRFGPSGIPEEIPMDNTWAEPMRQALMANRGAIVALDYRGHEVIAGYSWSRRFNIGVVAKRDLSEFQKPYVQAFMLCISISVIICMVSWIFVRKLNRVMIQGVKKTRELLEATFDSINDSVITINSEGIIQYANKSTVALFGYDINELLGNNISIIMPKNHRDMHDDYLRKYLVTNKPNIIRRAVDFIAVKKDGARFPIKLSVSESTSLEEVMYIGVIRDISEEKHLQRSKDELNKELQRSNKELSKFAYIASHDLRAPLRGIKTTAKWVEEDLGDNVDPEIKDNLQLMQNRIERLDTLLDSLLNYSRVSTEERQYEKVNVRELLEDVVFVVCDDNVTVNIQCNDIEIYTVRVHLQQVFQNLIDNAIKHHDELIPIEITIYIRNEKDSIWCSVKDNGCGIPLEHQKKIFEVFQRLVRRDEVEGTGIGLALVKKLIELHGGDLEVHSVPPVRGTEFCFFWIKERG
ncbi:ATP-binding protein [Shewanella submarina]|uniref:histidine kinase n=1 Tax=Shewanella submarina TaxID=2016376 RepID=A0ABV7GJ22_9GAMM|nr:ATP-binding protein [Shewanella submarina]MCL1038117.1 ATP-binding protein [Shewanella submarina]